MGGIWGTWSQWALKLSVVLPLTAQSSHLSVFCLCISLFFIFFIFLSVTDHMFFSPDLSLSR